MFCFLDGNLKIIYIYIHILYFFTSNFFIVTSSRYIGHRGAAFNNKSDDFWVGFPLEGLNYLHFLTPEAKKIVVVASAIL